MSKPNDSALRPRRISKRKLLVVCVVAVLTSPALFMALLLALAIQTAPVKFDHEAAAQIRYTPLEQVVPGASLPENVSTDRSNNNLDLIRYEDRYYFAFRTAPTHFASPHVRMYVLSSDDLKTWRCETEFFLGKDMREPRFLEFDGRLLFYFFEAGDKMLEFMPRQTYASERKQDGTWSPIQPVFDPGFVMWRFREHNGIAWAAAYYGSGLYSAAERTGEVRLLRSSDGYHWEPISEEPQLSLPGAEEPEFVFSPEGDLTVLVRLELSGGSLLCSASADDLSRWKTVYSPLKYDSSLMFTHDNTIYLIARRNIAGDSARAPQWLPVRSQQVYNLVYYWLTRKRTALYRVDVTRECITPLFDFPSRGDTAFAGITPLDDDNRYYVLNYSSSLDGMDWPWIFGQMMPTNIYGTTLTFE